MHVYEDPCDPKRRRPSLIGGLMRYPSTTALSPEENQFTEALAWLLDWSPEFARRFARLFFTDDVAIAALESASAFGARTQVGLPKPHGNGVVWPDLALAGDRRSFELLVEVKIGSEPHEYALGEEVLLQPDLYLAAWDLRPPQTQAEVRRVGTLTNGFAFPVPSNAGRAADMTWESLSELLDDLIAAGQLGDVALVAADFRAAVDERILKQARLPPPEHVQRLLEDGVVLLELICKQLAGAIGATWRAGPRKQDDYSRAFVQFPRPEGGQPFHELWLIVTPEGGKYNLYGRSDTIGVVVYERYDTRFVEETRLLAGGFTRVRDLAGYVRDGLHFDLVTEEGRIPDLKTVATEASSGIAAALKECSPPLA